MNLSFLNSLFKKNSDTLHVPDSILVKKLKSLCSQSNLLIYSNVKIYHHRDKYTIPLIMLDPLRGFYIFEIQTWSYDDLKNAHIEKAKNQKSSAVTLSFDNTHDIIKKKFNELTHNDGVPIFNYLIMENLSADEYQHLNESFKELLPFEKLIFSDDLETDIFKKLQKASEENQTLPSINNILGTLFIQYTLIDEHSNLHFATQEQIEFINTPMEEINILRGPASSGKSILLLLKALVILLENPKQKIIILKPTILACDILKKRVLELVEHAIIELNLTSIEIITPIELVNRHCQKLRKPSVENLEEMPLDLIGKKFHPADTLLCDDTGLLDPGFVSYLKNIQQKNLLLVNDVESHENEYKLSQSFEVQNRVLYFLKTNPYAKTLQLVNSFLKNNPDENILVVSLDSTAKKLKEDLDSFVTQNSQLLDSEIHLLDQNFSQLMLANYIDINTLSAKHIIMLDICFTSLNQLEYALSVTTQSAHILYEEDCLEINQLKEKYENSKERRGVEETTLS